MRSLRPFFCTFGVTQVAGAIWLAAAGKAWWWSAAIAAACLVAAFFISSPVQRKKNAMNPETYWSNCHDHFYGNSTHHRGLPMDHKKPAVGGHRGGTQTNRVGTSGSPSNGASAGARPRVMDEFSGTSHSAEPLEDGGFAVGVLRGTRSFRVDSLGRLTGVHHRQVWRPGTNEAECRSEGDDYAAQMMRVQRLMQSVYGGGGDPEPTFRSDKHSIDACKHGFYAYYEGSDDYHEPGYVSAVVEGFGECVVGTRGFRSMKARIVALHIPEDVPAHLSRLVARNYPDVAILGSFEQMVSEFPCDSAGREMTPDTDPDFWTRRV